MSFLGGVTTGVMVWSSRRRLGATVEGRSGRKDLRDPPRSLASRARSGGLWSVREMLTLDVSETLHTSIAYLELSSGLSTPESLRIKRAVFVERGDLGSPSKIGRRKILSEKSRHRELTKLGA